MERKIGEIFEHNGEWYQCADWAVNPCSKCDFDGEGICCDELPCTSSQRKDKKYVFFNKLEKVGEPFSCNYYGDKRLIMMQEYRAYDNRIIPPNGIPMYVTDEKHKKVAIEIRQNQENMEENKLNLKPFDLEAARSGKPVCTRDGRKARIICFDYKGATNDYPIVALMEYNNDKGDVFEKVEKYTNEGNYNKYGGNKHPNDLMMLPEKHEGWVNICKNADDDYFVKGIFRSEKFARNNGVNYPGLIIATVKISWEE